MGAGIIGAIGLTVLNPAMVVSSPGTALVPIQLLRMMELIAQVIHMRHSTVTSMPVPRQLWHILVYNNIAINCTYMFMYLHILNLDFRTCSDTWRKSTCKVFFQKRGTCHLNEAKRSCRKTCDRCPGNLLNDNRYVSDLILKDVSLYTM